MGHLDGDSRFHRDGEQVRESGGEGAIPNPPVEPEQGRRARPHRDGGPNAEDPKQLYDGLPELRAVRPLTERRAVDLGDICSG